MPNDENELAYVKAKVDSMQKEISEFKTTFHNDFVAHQKDDKENFTAIADELKATQIKQASIIESISSTKAAIRKDFKVNQEQSNKNIKFWGLIISGVGLALAVVSLTK